VPIDLRGFFGLNTLENGCGIRGIPRANLGVLFFKYSRKFLERGDIY
jgi:hypothetical protein